MRGTAVHPLTHVLPHRMQPLLQHLGRGGRQRVALHAELLELAEAADGVREGRDVVVARVQLHEGEEEADRVG